MKIKIALNRCFGGFSLSNKAVEMIYEYMSAEERKRFFYDPYVPKHSSEYESEYVDNAGFAHYPKYYEEAFRMHPEVIRAIEFFGKSANGDCAEIEIVEFEPCIGIEDYDGMERLIVGGFSRV